MKLTTAGKYLLQHRRSPFAPWRTLLHCGRKDMLVKLLDRIGEPGELRVRDAGRSDDDGTGKPNDNRAG